MFLTRGVCREDLELGQLLAEMLFGFLDLQTILESLLPCSFLLQELIKDNVIVLAVVEALEHEIEVPVITERFNEL